MPNIDQPPQRWANCNRNIPGTHSKNMSTEHYYYMNFHGKKYSFNQDQVAVGPFIAPHTLKCFSVSKCWYLYILTLCGNFPHNCDNQRVPPKRYLRHFHAVQCFSFLELSWYISILHILFWDLLPRHYIDNIIRFLRRKNMALVDRAVSITAICNT